MGKKVVWFLAGCLRKGGRRRKVKEERKKKKEKFLIFFPYWNNLVILKNPVFSTCPLCLKSTASSSLPWIINVGLEAKEPAQKTEGLSMLKEKIPGLYWSDKTPSLFFSTTSVEIPFLFQRLPIEPGYSSQPLSSNKVCLSFSPSPP